MPRPCTICASPRLNEITADLMARKPYRVIQSRYGVSKSSIDRHVTRHVHTALHVLASKEMSAIEAATIGEPVLAGMRRLNARALRILADAEGAQDRLTALAAIRECRRNLELIAKLTGELDPHSPGEASGGPLTVVIQYVDKQQVVTNQETPSARVAEPVAALLPAPEGGREAGGPGEAA